MTMMGYRHRWMRFCVPLVWLAIVQVLLLSMLASSPEMHGHFHLSSHDSDHHCLATDFKSGLIEQPLVAPMNAPRFMPVFIDIVPSAADARRSMPVHLCGSLLEHGPPPLV